MPIKIIRNDITKMKVDVIVNAANNRLKMGGGVCGAIFSAAGSEKLQEECDKIGKCNVGEAVITKGYNLQAKYIIHTVGPIWKDGSIGEANELYNCYYNSLTLAIEHECKSIAFPLISSGIYGYPKEEALKIAFSSITEFLIKNEIMVYLVVYDNNSLVLSEKLFSAIEKYVDDKYVDDSLLNETYRNIEYYKSNQRESTIENYSANYKSISLPHKIKKRSLEEVISKIDESFSQMLLRLIDEKGMSDVETYKRANIDRKLFSKIRSSKGYSPSKVTAIAFAIALRLNLDETLDLLSKAGYTLSHSNKFDIIVEYFIEEGNHNIHDINEALFVFEQVLLGE